MIVLLSNMLLGLVRLLVGARGVGHDLGRHDQSRIYFANHTSHLDTLVVLAALPGDVRRTVHPAAALDYWGSSKGKRFIAEQLLNSILIDRQRSTDADPLEPVMEVLHNKESVLIFPEGTRGHGDRIESFRSGLYNLAARFPDRDLVPVYLDNLSRIMPKGSFLVVPMICTPRFGAPIRLKRGEERRAFLDRARDALAELALPRDGGAA
ncbi:lysophospholipid acyltransferase family protein [Corticibacterium sp. UT-5YL-CI-8]|nr:lysophospholipid acyltransferase family protein [Tianweitania sp. UT-5YL-CI-8]